jgi:hypothetical protein
LLKRLEAVDLRTASLNEALGDLRRRSEEMAGSLRDMRARADAAAAAARESRTLASQAASAGVEPRQLEALAARLGALERDLLAAKEQLGKAVPPTATDRAVRQALLAETLRQSVERGAPFATELGGLKTQGADAAAMATLEALAATGIPSIARLQQEFASQRDALLRAEAAKTDGGIMERLQANAERLVRIRPVGEVAGDDTRAVVARIEAQLGRGDVAAAVAEAARLPAERTAPAWLQLARARLAAIDAARRLAGDAMRALAKSGS